MQDYSYHISQMVSLTPSQFCRVAAHHQRGRRLQFLDFLAKPGLYEVDASFALPCRQGANDSEAMKVTPQPIKVNFVSGAYVGACQLRLEAWFRFWWRAQRLGWNNLALEPEHLSERLKDALQTMGASYEMHICSDSEAEIFVLHAKIDDVACRVTVSEDPCDGTQRISVTRLAGDTFEYHKSFRQLREHLGDACTYTHSK